MMFNLLGIIEGSMPGKSRTISLDLSRAMLASGSSPKLDRRVSPPSSAKSRCFVRLRSPTLRPPAKHAHHHRGVHACRGKALQFWCFWKKCFIDQSTQSTPRAEIGVSLLHTHTIRIRSVEPPGLSSTSAFKQPQPSPNAPTRLKLCRSRAERRKSSSTSS